MPKQKDGLLNSWKEIANYLGRGVRTVQRWERSGLPVRRLGSGSRAPVIANASEIDQWLQRVASRTSKSVPVEQVSSTGSLRESIGKARVLRQQMVALRDGRASALSQLMTTVAKLEEACLLPAIASWIPEDSGKQPGAETQPPRRSEDGDLAA